MSVSSKRLVGLLLVVVGLALGVVGAFLEFPYTALTPVGMLIVLAGILVFRHPSKGGS
jgi:hypothetical protein